MAYEGFATFGGVEVWNADRFHTYVPELAPGWAQVDCETCGDLARALGDGSYNTPLVDQPDWYDPDNPDSWRFAGFLPLTVTGLVDSTRTATVSETMSDGGVVGVVRHGPREIRVSGLLVAADDCALEAGFEWFKRALDGSACDECGGDDLCFFTCCPAVADGVVNPDSPLMPHPIELGIGWSATGGRWRAGHLTARSHPATAVGPVIEPPCDDVTVAVIFGPAADGEIIRVGAVTDDGDPVATGEPVLRALSNHVRNPTFRNSITRWDTPDAVSVTKVDGMPAADLTIASDVPAGTVILSTALTGQVEGDQWGGGVTVEAAPSVTNLVPNPRVGYTSGWAPRDNTDPWIVARDASPTFSEPWSYRVSRSTGIGVQEVVSGVWVGADDDGPFRIRVTGGSTYTGGVHVWPTETASVQGLVIFYDASGVPVGSGFVDPVAAAPGEWTFVPVAGTAPAAAVYARIFATADTSSGGPAGADAGAWWDAAILTEGPDPVDYFDPGVDPDARWVGEPDMSPSYLLSTTVDDVAVAAGVSGVYGEPVALSTADPVRVEFRAVEPPSGPGRLEIVASADIPAGTVLRVREAVAARYAGDLPYFDGDTPWDGFNAAWRSAADDSESVMTWPFDGFVVTVPTGTGPFRPTIAVDAGASTTVTGVTVLMRDTVDPEECAAQYMRTIRDVTVTEGPTVLDRWVDDCGDGAVMRVEFVLTAGIPWVWRMIDTEFRVVDPGAQPPPDSGGGGGFYPRPGISPQACPDAGVVPPPLSDPDCPLPPAPPTPPRPAECIADVDTYTRNAVGIPGDMLSPWEEAVPVVSMQVNTATAVRQARIRFYPNPLDRDSLDDLEECAYCGEFLVSYIPGNAELTIDGETQRATVTMPGDVVRDATHLLYGSDGGPMTWPLLTCGMPYVMTVDTAPTSTEVLATSVRLAVRS